MVCTEGIAQKTHYIRRLRGPPATTASIDTPMLALARCHRSSIGGRGGVASWEVVWCTRTVTATWATKSLLSVCVAMLLGDDVDVAERYREAENCSKMLCDGFEMYMAWKKLTQRHGGLADLVD